MSEKTCKTVRFWCGNALAAMTIILGALFIWQVLDLYLGGLAAGKQIIFSRVEVFSRVAKISPAFWIWVVMIAGAFAVWEIFPVADKKTGWKDPRYALYRLNKRIPENAEGELKADLDFVKRERKILNYCWMGLAVLALAGIIYSIVYLATPSNFTGVGNLESKNVTADILNLVRNVFPWAAAVFIAACGICVYEGISAKNQLPHAKKLAAGNKVQVRGHGAVYGKVMPIVRHKYFLLGVRIAVGCIAVAFIIAGIFNGNMGHILEKAVNICMECIGLG